MEVNAEAKYVRISPQKVRRVLNLIRGKSAQEALAILKFLPQSAAGVVNKVLASAIANAEHNNKLSKSALEVSKAVVGVGPVSKRFAARARGRINEITKRTSHIKVWVKERSK
ncbi:MAG: 50S ribosomal protein L22 [Candidatus Margulisiibacteriota bacterium]|jgi:large subunit ribosomal protein L22